jgi:hypothetical protein
MLEPKSLTLSLTLRTTDWEQLKRLKEVEKNLTTTDNGFKFKSLLLFLSFLSILPLYLSLSFLSIYI